MRILALIPARGGSKRLPGKNIRSLGGKPLVVWSIDIVKAVSGICDILVSTDDQLTASIAQSAGAFVPWLRPAELADDATYTVDVVLHALNWYEEEYGAVDGVLLLQPTSPFRTKECVRKGIELFVKNGGQSVLGVSPTQAHPMWTLKKDGKFVVPFMQDHGFSKRSQDLPPAFAVNGSLYLTSTRQLRDSKSLFSEKAIPLIIESPKEALDIDTEEDWRLAEYWVEPPNNDK